MGARRGTYEGRTYGYQKPEGKSLVDWGYEMHLRRVAELPEMTADLATEKQVLTLGDPSENHAL